MSTWIGIDPGKKGAISLITFKGRYETWDMPVLPNGEIDSRAIYDILYQFENIKCVLEKSQPMPQQGVTSVFNYGRGYGKIQSILEILKIPYAEIRPTQWKKEFGLIKKDKKQSVTLAKKLFPGAELVTPRGRLIDGRAEALLMAEYGRRKNL